MANALVAQDTHVQELAARIVTLQTQATAIVIDNPERVQTATDLLGLIARMKKGLEERRQVLVKPLNDQVREINDTFKGYSGPLEDADRIVRQKVIAFNQAEEQRRRQEEARLRELQAKEQAKLEKQAARKGLEAPPPQPAVVVPQAAPTVRSEAATVTTKKVWDFEVTDKAAVPESFKLVNEAAIRAAVRAGVREIAGCRIFERDELAVRTR